MKRFHAHVAVANIEISTAFYSQLFGLAPSKLEVDYAKWMLEDPPLNFAISSRGHASGLNHFGFQVDSVEELENLKQQAQMAAPGTVLDQNNARCCYAQSEKHWTIDPQGIAWESFYTLADVPVFGEDSASGKGACCVPGTDSNGRPENVAEQSCSSGLANQPQGACCG